MVKFRILPQSYFHALIVELSSKSKEINLNLSCNHSRFAFRFLLTLPSGDECRVRLVDCVFWLEVSIDDFVSCDECQPLLDIIQSSTRDVLKQLKLSHIGELQYGLCCYSPKCSLPKTSSQQVLESYEFNLCLYFRRLSYMEGGE